MENDAGVQAIENILPAFFNRQVISELL